MSVENRFARDTNYIFFSQYLTEVNSVISNVQISLRKQCPFSKEGKKVTREMLCNKETLKELFKEDEAIKYLKPIRGTPPYWQSSQKDIFAMIRQLGVPTLFCSFSSADFRWSEIVNTIFKQQGDIRNNENMTWDEKCKVLCSNPVTALNYIGYDKYQFVRPNHLEQALVYLKDKNVWYKDVAINDEWINPMPEVNDDQVVTDESDSDFELVGNKKIQKDEFENMSKSLKVGNEREVESEQYSYIDDRLRGVQLDTCLQPADIGQEALDL
ncbi:Hypothetical predicted protein [Mytilus galloprovincialis]|uniref:Helitron helicase-like domain-containing protein n=1 Tax=Mytilus galloprovincialis TaxID=29158 RepID=A0A8B6GPX4_MYTGA|nr:Hypothetical predicted protein [Mytilus galloprovincialis]